MRSLLASVMLVIGVVGCGDDGQQTGGVGGSAGSGGVGGSGGAPDAAGTDGAGGTTGWPDATNTGYRTAPGYPGSLTTYSPTPVSGQECSGPIASNKTYHFCKFPQGLSIGSVGNAITNTTFFGCQFLSNAVDNANVTYANGDR